MNMGNGSSLSLAAIKIKVLLLTLSCQTYMPNNLKRYYRRCIFVHNLKLIAEGSNSCRSHNKCNGRQTHMSSISHKTCKLQIFEMHDGQFVIMINSSKQHE